MIKTDNLYSSVSPSSSRHHSSGKQNIESPHEIKKSFEDRQEIKRDNKEGINKHQIRTHQERKKIKTEISVKDHSEKQVIEGKGTDRSSSADKISVRKTCEADEKKSKSGGKTAEKKVINIGNTFKELRKAIDNLNTHNSPGTASQKFLPEKTFLYRASLQSDPAMSYPVTREQKILASLVTGDVKPFFREEKDKHDIKKDNSPEHKGEDIKKNNGRFIKQGRRGKNYKDESKINYFFNPVIPKEDSKKKLEEYLKKKYSVTFSGIKGGEEKSRPSMVSPGVSPGLKKNDELLKKTSLQSPLSRFLNHNVHTTESLKTESPLKHDTSHDEKLQTKQSSVQTEPLKSKTQAIVTEPVFLVTVGPVFMKPTVKLSTRQEKVEFFVASLKNQGVVDIENIGVAGKNSSLNEDEINYFLVWLSAKGKKFVDFNDSKISTMSDIFVYASGANGDMFKFIQALEMYATSPYATSGGVGKESFEALAFIAGHPVNWDKLMNNIGKITGGWSVGGVDFSREDVKKEIRSWLYKLDEQSANPLVPKVWDKFHEETDCSAERDLQDNPHIKDEHPVDNKKTSSETQSSTAENNKSGKVEISDKTEGSSQKISKRERVQNFVNDLVRKGNNLSPVAIHTTGRHHGLKEEEVNRFITWLSEVDAGNINFNDRKVNMICDVFIASTEANKDMVKFAQSMEMSSSAVVGS